MKNSEERFHQGGKGGTVPDPTVEEINEIIRKAEELRKLKESYQPEFPTPTPDCCFYPTPGGVGTGDGGREKMEAWASLEDPEGCYRWPDEVQTLIDELLHGLLAPCRAFINTHGPERLQDWDKVEGWIWTANPADMKLLIRELGGLKAIVAKITQAVQSPGELKEPSSTKTSEKSVARSENKKIRKSNRKISSELTPKETEIYTMIYLHNKTQQQAAIELSCTPQNISKLLKKAEAKMKAKNSRSINLKKAQKLPEDRRAQTNISNDGF